MKHVKQQLICLLLVGTAGACAQSFSEKKEVMESFTMQAGQTLEIENINGDVEVTAYDGREVTVETIITIKASSQSKLDQGMKELEVKIRDTKKGKLVSMMAPFIRERYDEEKDRYHRQWSEGDPGYDFDYAYRVSVPRDVQVAASTVNRGDVIVTGVTANLVATNVNGHIIIEDAQEVAHATTVNGKIDISYKSRPSVDAYFHTINGNINLYLPKNAKMNVEAKSMNGELFSSFEVEYQKPVMETRTSQKNGAKVYKLSEKSVVSIGGGGPLMKMETLNGNMYLKQTGS